MGLAQLLIFVNSQLLWADLQEKKIFDSKALRTEWTDSVYRKLNAEEAGAKVRKSRRKTMKAIGHSLMGRFGHHSLEKWPQKKINPRTGRERTKQIECYYCRQARKVRKDTSWYCKLCTESIGLPVGFCNNKHRKCYPLFKFHKIEEEDGDSDDDIDL